MTSAHLLVSEKNAMIHPEVITGVTCLYSM